MKLLPILFAVAGIVSAAEEPTKKILALGGNGFIGSAVLHNLLTKGQYKEASHRGVGAK